MPKLIILDEKCKGQVRNTANLYIYLTSEAGMVWHANELWHTEIKTLNFINTELRYKSAKTNAKTELYMRNSVIYENWLTSFDCICLKELL